MIPTFGMMLICVGTLSDTVTKVIGWAVLLFTDASKLGGWSSKLFAWGQSVSPDKHVACSTFWEESMATRDTTHFFFFTLTRVTL